MSIAYVNGTALYFEEHGTGHPLVFVHGLGASHKMWAPQVETFSRTYRVITFDVRGSGQSGRLTGWRDILHRQAADLTALLNQLHLEQIALCGVSYGGVFAQRFALDYPMHLAALIIVDSFGSTRPHTLKELGLMLSVNLGAPAYLLPHAWLLPTVAKQYAHWPLAQQHLLQIIREMRSYETMKTRLAINWINYLPKLRYITCPTLGIVGDHSAVAVNYMRQIVNAIPKASLKVVKDSFDPTNLCQREIFDQLLSDFLQNYAWQRV